MNSNLRRAFRVVALVLAGAPFRFSGDAARSNREDGR